VSTTAAATNGQDPRVTNLGTLIIGGQGWDTAQASSFEIYADYDIELSEPVAPSLSTQAPVPPTDWAFYQRAHSYPAANPDDSISTYQGVTDASSSAMKLAAFGTPPGASPFCGNDCIIFKSPGRYRVIIEYPAVVAYTATSAPLGPGIPESAVPWLPFQYIVPGVSNVTATLVRCSQPIWKNSQANNKTFWVEEWMVEVTLNGQVLEVLRNIAPAGNAYANQSPMQLLDYTSNDCITHIIKSEGSVEHEPNLALDLQESKNQLLYSYGPTPAGTDVSGSEYDSSHYSVSTMPTVQRPSLVLASGNGLEFKAPGVYTFVRSFDCGDAATAAPPTGANCVISNYIFIAGAPNVDKFDVLVTSLPAFIYQSTPLGHGSGWINCLTTTVGPGFAPPLLSSPPAPPTTTLTAARPTLSAASSPEDDIVLRLAQAFRSLIV